MTAAKIIWSGTYAGIDADVRIVNGAAVPFLAGLVAIFPGDVGGVLGAAVMGLATERDRKDAELRGLYNKRQDVLDGMTRAVEAEGRANKAFYDMQAERDELRERLAKLEAGLATACDEWEYASQYKGDFLAAKHGDAEDIAELRELLKGPSDVKA